ncbi:hypothetical protein [Candidatus Saccharimonas aalborgensis]|uniref:hypothetical protein n=1 Tax=Candidatus Saccharimonas aalborgensis TaxID=1332188 RepID=UPI00039BCBFD|nr:hypothetical protein [Candidatus Saccharimonas aalborgensis]QQS68052.1 MAG: hypothetical protein IPP24_03475 [Candidatus Saccharibacteria bacterium]
MIAYGVLFAIASLFTEPPITHEDSIQHTSFLRAIRQVVTRRTVWSFSIAGLVMAFATSPVDLYNLSFVALGLNPQYMGLLYAAPSIIGAALGYIVHHLRRLTFQQYASLDIIMNILMMTSIGFFKSLPLAIAAHVINMAMWRYQSIMYQHYLLELFGSSRYKATLLSVTNNFKLIHEVWLTLLFAGIAQQIGIIGAVGQGVWMIVLTWPFMLIAIARLKRMQLIKKTMDG